VGRIRACTQAHHAEPACAATQALPRDPCSIRFGEKTAKGYLLSDLEKVFALYTTSQTGTASQPDGESGFADSETVTNKFGATADSNGFPDGENDCDGVTDQNAEMADREEF